ncbi:MAG: hypothetical protein ABFD80_08605 [Acidobacteriota bacterium]
MGDIIIRMAMEGAMLVRRALLIILAISFLPYCAHNPSPSSVVPAYIGKLTTALANERISKICDQTGFKVGGHFLNKIDKPIIVRKIKGRMVPRDDNRWPELCGPPLFQIRAMGKGTKIMTATGDINGKFVMENIPDGQYCFHASCYGWNDCAGIIIVDKKADRKKKIFLELDPA